MFETFRSYGASFSDGFLARLYPFLEGQHGSGISLLFSTPDFLNILFLTDIKKSLANSQDAKSFIDVTCFQNG